MYLDHIGNDQIYMKLPNPWFNAQSPNQVYKWGADFNHESPATQQLVDRITSYWMTEYKMDGFRFDFTKGFTNTPGDGNVYDASRIAILKRIADKIWSINPKAYVILEHLTPNSEETELANYGMMLWGNMNYNFSNATMGFSSDLSGISSNYRGWNSPDLDGYMESHDEERLMYRTLTNGASSGTYNTRTLATALKRMELATVFFLSVPGPKMIWQFGELGYDVSIDSLGRTSPKPLRWHYYKDTNRYRLFLIYKIMNHLRKTQSVFNTPDYSYSLSSMQKRLTLNSTEMKVNILGNFDVTSGSIIPAFPQAGKWYEYFKDDSINVSDVNEPIDLQPGEYRLYTTTRLKSPKLILSYHDITLGDNKSFVHVYPNPSKGDFIIETEDVSPSPVNISVFDISGRLVRRIKSEIVAPGNQQFGWDGKTESGLDAANGLYFIQVKVRKRTETVKVVKE
jgi:hypothetical protein